jgi:hypothetical protein
MRCAPDVEGLQVAIEQLVDGRIRSWMALLVDVAGDSADGLGRRGPGLRPCRDDLSEIVAAYGERSTPAYTATRRVPLGSVSTLARARFGRSPAAAMV